MDMEREMDRLQDENAALRAELDQERRACTTFHLALQEMATDRDALRAALARAYDDRDYWLAWKEAVPMDDIRCIAQEGQLQSWYEIKALNNWLATLDGAA